MPTTPEGRRRPWIKPAEKGERPKYSRDNRYHSQRWRKTSKAFLQANPLCVHCLEIGRTEPSKVTDHIVQARKNEYDFYDSSNYQALCEYHHNVKRGKERHGK